MKTFIISDQRLSEVVLADPSLIPLINRFGITLGLGDATIAQLCQLHDIELSFFLVILNTYAHSDYFPEHRFNAELAPQIIAYLTKANEAYTRFLLPNIERHLRSFIERSDPNNEKLTLLHRFFMLFKEELQQRIVHDQQVVFPTLLQRSKHAEGDAVSLHESSMPEDHIAQKLSDMKQIMVKHLQGDYDPNLCYAVLISICNLEKDILQHNRIRNKILFPFTEALHQLKD